MKTPVHGDFIAAVGNTPLIRLKWASEVSGANIFGKAEFMNPGGSVKDRAALYMIQDAEKRGLIKPGGTLIEATGGNTGIGVALVGNALGYKSIIVMPDTQAQEKKDTVRACGAELREVPAVPYKDPNNYVHVAQRLADEVGGYFCNQFDNTANRDGHIQTTGPEIWDALDGKIDAFTTAVGTGGTLAGISIALKERSKSVLTVAADPGGSVVHDFIKTGELTTDGGSITEGIGQGRVTLNMKDAPLDDAERILDPEALDAIYNMVLHDGLVMGGSTGINVASAIRVGKKLGPGANVVTILCDHGSRYQSKIYNPEFLHSKDLPIPPWMA
ncbi:MAG: cysteine synthase A [Alphaproteobacteria bacterium]|nr:cysteine synthase A [Alphaproteobacteria bacterium]